MRIAIHLTSRGSEPYPYPSAIERIGGLELVESKDDAITAQKFDALITDDPSVAKSCGLPCLLDRPESCSREDLEILAESAVPVMPVHLWRYSPALLPIQESHRVGLLGEPGLLRIHHWAERKEVLGTLAELAFGQVDLALLFFGSDPDVCFQLASGADYGQWHLGFAQGGMAMIDIAIQPGSCGYYSLHLIGSQGAAYVDDHHNTQLHFGARGPNALLEPLDPVLAVESMLRRFVGFVGEVGSSCDPARRAVTLKDSLKVFEVLEELKLQTSEGGRE